MTEKQSSYGNKAQTIFRVAKNPDNPFVMIDRRPLERETLSWGAKGLLAYLLSRPDDWVVRFKDLVKRSPDGAHKVRGFMKELRNAGHVQVITHRDGGRITEWEYKVFELPPDIEFQQVEKQDVVNRTFNNNKKPLTKKKVKEPTAPTPPEIQYFRKVTKRYPNKVLFEDVSKSIQKVLQRVSPDAIITELETYFKAWTRKGYNPLNLAWLEWAEAGTIPQNGTWRPTNANYQTSDKQNEYSDSDRELAERIKARRSGLS